MPEIVPVHLAVEDALSEAVLRTILRQSGQRFAIGTCYQRGGFGYLKEDNRGIQPSGEGHAIFRPDGSRSVSMPASMIADWLRVPKHSNLLFRIAVRQVESWVLADQEAMASFLGIAQCYPQEHRRTVRCQTIPDGCGSPVSQQRASPSDLTAIR